MEGDDCSSMQQPQQPAWLPAQRSLLRWRHLALAWRAAQPLIWRRCSTEQPSLGHPYSFSHCSSMGLLLRGHQRSLSLCSSRTTTCTHPTLQRRPRSPQVSSFYPLCINLKECSNEKNENPKPCTCSRCGSTCCGSRVSNKEAKS